MPVRILEAVNALEMLGTNDVEQLVAGVDAASDVLMRPKIVVYFEVIMLGTLLLGVARVYLNVASLGKFLGSMARAFDMLLPGLIIEGVPVLVIMLTLTLLVSRRRSKKMMWVFIATAVVGVVPFFLDLNSQFRLLYYWSHDIVVARTFVYLGVLQFAQAAAFALLFTPSARRWITSMTSGTGGLV